MRAAIAVVLAVGLGPAALADHALDGRDIAAGERLYAEHCASCHEAKLEGQPHWQIAGPDGVLPAPPHDETGHTWHHETQLLFDYVKLGGAETLRALGVEDVPSGMPAFGDAMSDNEIYDVLAFIRSTWPPRLQAIQRSRDPVHE